MLIFQVCFDVFYETEQPDMSQDRLYMRKQRFAATYVYFMPLTHLAFLKMKYGQVAMSCLNLNS